MNLYRWILTPLTVIAASVSILSIASATVTLDRDYRLGDDASEGAMNGAPVNSTFDSAGLAGQGQLVDLAAVNTPTYVAISGRPDGVAGRGIQFDAAQSEYLHGFSLGFPVDSFSSSSHTTLSGGNINYAGISNRGFQFWVRPTSTAVQSIVVDTNQHGVRVNSSGKFSMRYAGLDIDTTLSVVPNTWYHVEVVRPSGAANGARMYVDGNAVAAALGGYDNDWSDLVVGSNTAGDDSGTHVTIPSPVGFTGGTGEYFSGIVDDLKMFVVGTTTTGNINYGTFSFPTDNGFAAFKLTAIAGDTDNNGVLNQTDKNNFIAGWQKKRLVNNVQIGDLFSHLQGDLNFDGITDIKDLLIMQNALSGSGVGAITAADLSGVPEPSTVILALLSALGAISLRRGSRT